MRDKIIILKFSNIATIALNINELIFQTNDSVSDNPTGLNTALYIRPKTHVDEKYEKKRASDNSVVEITRKQNEVILMFNLLISDLKPNVINVIMSCIRKVAESPTVHELTLDVKKINQDIDNYCNQLPFQFMKEQEQKNKE